MLVARTLMLVIMMSSLAGCVGTPLGSPTPTSAIPTRQLVRPTATPQLATTPEPGTAVRQTRIITIIAARTGVTVTAAAPAGARCSIKHEAPDGTLAQALGMRERLASATSRVSWSWSPPEDLPSGEGKVTVSCAPGGEASEPLVIE